ncbi:hypothetical protein O181_078488 [Austropuccinia psidii MF-1]|uniref:Uncharacterized protein n=1 Tax=Austropuccinia psidii MF-1 TaxID=1389203 RepID=A0A9Q3FEW0_9BASI|nr:hypothetical protein [Austropuccinia psidii MF-1]
MATQRSRKPRNSASIQGQAALTACTGKITIINPVVTSKGKLHKSEDNKCVQRTVKETLASKGSSQRTEKACLEPEHLEEDTLDTVVDGKTMREITLTLPFTLQFNRTLKTEDWKDMDQVLQLHQLLKDFFQWSMDNKRFNLASQWPELGASCWRKCLKEIDFKDLMVINKGWNPTRKLRILEARENRIMENQATIHAIDKQLTQTGPTQIPPGSQGAGQISSPVASHHSETNKSVTRSHHSSQFQEKTRIQGEKEDLFQSKEERVRPNDPEVVGFGEKSAQEPEAAVKHSGISSPINVNITPTQIEHNAVSPESNLNIDAL